MQVDEIERRVGVAAGYAKTFPQARKLVLAGMRRIVLGTYMLERRPGNPGSTYQVSLDGYSTWNWLGVPCKPLEEALRVDVIPFVKWCDEYGYKVHLSISIAAPTVDDLISCAGALESAHVTYDELDDKLLIDCISGIEINGSCQNTDSVAIGFMPDVVNRGCMVVTSMLHGLPVGFKFPPYLVKATLREDAYEAAVAGGASMLVTSNTLNVTQLTRPLLACVESQFGRTFDRGSFGGSILTPIARDELSAAVAGGYGVPVVSVGGILSPEEVRVRFDIGADSVQLGSYLHLFGGGGLEELFQHLVD